MRTATLCLILLSFTACRRVMPYERARLAHPSMAEADSTGPGEQHVRAIQEGAVGGSLDAASGCGCN